MPQLMYCCQMLMLWKDKAIVIEVVGVRKSQGSVSLMLRIQCTMLWEIITSTKANNQSYGDCVREWEPANCLPVTYLVLHDFECLIAAMLEFNIAQQDIFVEDDDTFVTLEDEVTSFGGVVSWGSQPG